MSGYRNIDVSEVRRAFLYDPETGFVSRNGKRVGFITANGLYRAVQFGKYQIREHILIMAIVSGEWPSSQIDHRNRDGLDNKWSNLRPATAGQQQANRKVWAKSGVKGVGLHRSGKWRAYVTQSGTGHYLGLHSRIEDAAAAVQKARELAWHEFACG